jgi:hypothetical protein
MTSSGFHDILGRCLWATSCNTNSDSHLITNPIAGTPQTLVTTDEWVGPLDEANVNASVRAGEMTGTHGPTLWVSTSDDADSLCPPSQQPFAPAPPATLDIEVRAAPCVEVGEQRSVVHGARVQTLTERAPQPAPSSVPTDAAELVRLVPSIPLADLLPAAADAWTSVAAGAPLVDNADLDCNGFPDTGDHNGDGQITSKDVEDAAGPPRGDWVDIRDAGPLQHPTPPEDRVSHACVFSALTPGGSPMACSNPRVMDLDGDGQFTGVMQ